MAPPEKSIKPSAIARKSGIGILSFYKFINPIKPGFEIVLSTHIPTVFLGFIVAQKRKIVNSTRIKRKVNEAFASQT